MVLNLFFLISLASTSPTFLSELEQDLKASTNNQPVIGILSLPNYPYENFTVNGTSYIASSYVKYLEMSGARVVPIRIDHSFSEIDYLFTRLNGILFTGGSAVFWVNNSATPVLSPDYAAKACYIFNKVVQTNNQGQFYPLWGTCLGFEVLHVCANQQFGTVGNFNGEPSYARNSEFLPAAASSVIFNTLSSEWSKRVMDNMASLNVSLLSHYHGISPQAYVQYPALGNMFKVLSHMKDKSGTTFVGMVEGVKYPIYGTQFHPEKNLFEWNQASIPHFYEAVDMAQFLSNFFVTQARKNPNLFPSNEVTPALIYNWPPIFIDSYFETISAFN
jgi:gamma-glutamyl hydrolase